MVNSGTVVSVELNVPIKKNGGGTYKGYRIVYNVDGEIKKVEKAMQSLNFGNGPKVYEVLQELKPGDEFSVYMEKNDAGFWDVTNLQKGKAEDAPLPDTPPVRSSGNSRSSGGKVLGSTYETPEERKLKQRLIVRQAALNQSLEFHQGTNEVDVSTITTTAEAFESWVYRGLE